jgi:aspartyl-tRNA(Asn)/glutamyl-tRNA(Gln) amidotransferase subunit C
VAVSEDDVRYIAGLARLGLDPASLPRMVRELNGILGHMEVIAGVDVASAAGDEHAPDPLRTRDDGGTPQPLGRPAASFAPAMSDGFFLVPRLASHANEPEVTP